MGGGLLEIRKSVQLNFSLHARTNPDRYTDRQINRQPGPLSLELTSANNELSQLISDMQIRVWIRIRIRIQNFWSRIRIQSYRVRIRIRIQLDSDLRCWIRIRIQYISVLYQ